ncbi:hypothetical protein MSIBF_A1650015 [groundwater metagenome]|uniref:Uncharacterized protein n=1 Tax=groundwater metagenome TaxID=717931 RepID=A0A098E862_9ZZZZ
MFLNRNYQLELFEIALLVYHHQINKKTKTKKYFKSDIILSRRSNIKCLKQFRKKFSHRI